jgi:hypothetical protein
MPADSTVKIALTTLIFVGAWVFFTHPGRYALEIMGVYTECAVQAWSLRNHCAPPADTAALPPDTTFTPAPAIEPVAPPAGVTSLPRAMPEPPPPAQPRGEQGVEADRTEQLPSSPVLGKASVEPAVRETADINKALMDCLDAWDRDTHMARSEWRAVCQRMRPSSGRTQP